MLPAASEDDKWIPAPGDYVAISGTGDEWENVIGILDELVPESADEEEKWIVYVPISSADLRARRMVGVNDLTDYVRFELRSNSNRVRISPKHLERVDPADF